MTAAGATPPERPSAGATLSQDGVSGVQVRRVPSPSKDNPEPTVERLPRVNPRIRVPELPERLVIPTREELVTLALDTYKLALDNTRTYHNRRGVETTTPEPDFRAACEAIRVAAHIAGYTQKGGNAGPRGEAEHTAEQAMANVSKFRARAVKNGGDK